MTPFIVRLLPIFIQLRKYAADGEIVQNLNKIYYRNKIEKSMSPTPYSLSQFSEKFKKSIWACTKILQKNI